MADSIVFRPIYLKDNMGHGNARRRSLEECRYSLVALMDADDISLHDRFEKQLSFFDKKKVSVVGGQISEFVGTPNNITGIRSVPETHEEIERYMKKRCPMNQVSVMFNKDDVAKAGGYLDWYCEEDYYLWIRMIQQGFKFANVPDVLVNVRTGLAMTDRRGGWRYFVSEAKLQGYMLKKGIISVPRYLYNIGIRFGGEVVVSNRLRQRLYSFLRTKNKELLTEKESFIDNERKTERESTPFSVAMCVYGGDDPEWFDVALRSVIEQTIKPAEIVLVVDGPIPESIRNVIDKYENICNKQMA